MTLFTLHPAQTILLIVDVQEKLFPFIDRGPAMLNALSALVQGIQLLDLPILLSEQYPQGLGQTVEPLRALLGEAYHPWIKSTFSCVDNPPFFECMLSLPYTQWIVVGIEAHICVLQTVKGLLSAGKRVVVLNDAVGSRFSNDCEIGIAEMREGGARISGVETVLFELLKESTHPQFKAISQLIKSRCAC